MGEPRERHINMEKIPYQQQKQEKNFPENEENEIICQMYHLIPIGIILVCFEKELPIFSLNEQGIKLLGYESRDDFMEQVEEQFIHSIYREDRNRVWNEVCRQLQGRKKCEIICRLYKKDGGVLWVLLRGLLVETEEKRSCIAFSLVDVREQRDEEKSLDAMSEEVLAAVKEAEIKYDEELAYGEIIRKSAVITGRINLETNRIFEEKSKYSNIREIMGKTTADRFFEYFAAKVSPGNLKTEFSGKFNCRSLKELYEAGEGNVSMEIARTFDTTERRWLNFVVNILEEPKTGELHAFLYVIDKTEEKAVELITNTIIKNNYGYVVVVDGNTRQAAVYCQPSRGNDGRVSRTDINYEKAMENSIFAQMDEKDREQMQDACKLETVLEKLGENNSYQLFYSERQKNGEMRKKQIQFLMMHEEFKSFLLTIVDVQDSFTQQEKIKRELSAALEMAENASAVKSDFLARISHEIRTPMNAIMNLTEIAAGSLGDENLVADCLEKSKSASHYLLTLLNDILDMGRIDSQNITLEKSKIDIEVLLSAVSTIIEPQARLQGVKYILENNMSSHDCYVGDSIHLQQILLNLLNNAVKFTKRGGKVKLTISEPERMEERAVLRFKVSDTGIGMAEEFLPILFQPFEQEHNEATTRYNGRGLGLAIARNLARLMEGDISVESYLGVGSTFAVTVKLDMENCGNQETILTSMSNEISLNGKGKRILLVEDHPLNTVVARTLLEKKGFEVTHAENGELAVKEFRQREEAFFDLILMDIRMPVMDGITAAIQIRKMERKDAKIIPIIAMTANAYEEDKQRTKQAGMNEHLSKPIEPEKLFQTLEEYLFNLGQ